MDAVLIAVVYVCLVCALIVAVLVLRLPNQLIDSLEQCACAAADSNTQLQQQQQAVETVHSGMQLEFMCTARTMSKSTCIYFEVFCNVNKYVPIQYLFNI